MLDVENKLILQVAPAKMYDSLPVMHKLEVSVLYVVLWIRVMLYFKALIALSGYYIKL